MIGRRRRKNVTRTGPAVRRVRATNCSTPGHPAETTANPKALPSALRSGMEILDQIKSPYALNLPMNPSSIEEFTSEIFEYCLGVFVPSQFHPHSPTTKVLVSYMAAMALEYRPLLDALLATAALVMSPNSQAPKAMPATPYHSGIIGLSRDIESGKVDGTEDCLLATLTWLCAFEVRSCSLHRISLSNDGLDLEVGLFAHQFFTCTNILDCAAATPAVGSYTGIPKRIAFERYAVKAFVYHASNTSIFYSALEPPVEAGYLIRKFVPCFFSTRASGSEQDDPAQYPPML